MTTVSIMNPIPTTNPQAEPSSSTIPTRVSQEPMAGSQPIPEVVDRLRAIERNLATVHRVCSETWLTQGDYESALIHQEVAVGLDPDDVEYRNQLGFLRYVTGKPGAAEAFEYVVQRDGSNPEGWFNLAMIRFGEGNYVDAERYFVRAAECRSDDAEIWNNLGVSRFHLGRIRDARTCFERALQIDPNHEDASENLKACAG